MSRERITSTSLTAGVTYAYRGTLFDNYGRDMSQGLWLRGGGEGGGYNVLTPQRVHPNQPQYNQCMLKISIICNKFFFASHAVNCN
jgi:hypothetical protein